MKRCKDCKYAERRNNGRYYCTYEDDYKILALNEACEDFKERDINCYMCIWYINLKGSCACMKKRNPEKCIYFVKSKYDGRLDPRITAPRGKYNV